MMKSFKSALLALLFTLPLAASTVAHADGHFYGGYHGGPRFGVFVDPWPLLAYPYGYYPYAGYYPYSAPPVVVTQQVAPTVYVEQGVNAPNASTTNAPASSDWFYCRKAGGYYPYVKTCAEGWQRVPAQPQGQH